MKDGLLLDIKKKYKENIRLESIDQIENGSSVKTKKACINGLEFLEI